MGFQTQVYGTASFVYITHSAVVIRCESARHASDAGERRGRERPPPKSGGACDLLIEVLSVTYLYLGPMRGRSRPHLSLREGLEQPPRSGAQSTETDL